MTNPPAFLSSSDAAYWGPETFAFSPLFLSHYPLLLLPQGGEAADGPWPGTQVPAAPSVGSPDMSELERMLGTSKCPQHPHFTDGDTEAQEGQGLHQGHAGPLKPALAGSKDPTLQLL